MCSSTQHLSFGHIILLPRFLVCFLRACFSGFWVWFVLIFWLWQWLEISLCEILFLSMMENSSHMTMKNMKCCFHKVPANAVTSLRVSWVCQEVVLGSPLPWWFLNTAMFECLYTIFKILPQLLSFILLSFPYVNQFWNGTLAFSSSHCITTDLVP